MIVSREQRLSARTRGTCLCV